MNTFDSRTATVEEFAAEARRLHAARLERIRNMTPEEQQACARFMIDGYFQRAATLRVNELWGPEDMDIQIAECVKHYRMDNFQNSEEYEAERERLIEADRARRAAEASERARQEAAERNARARWIAQGNDPSVFGAADREKAGLDERDVDTLMEFLRDAIEFHQTRTRSVRHIRWWERVRDAVETGDVDAELVAEAERRGAGARPGGRFYQLWQMTVATLRQLA